MTKLYVMNRDGSGKRVLSGKVDQSVARPTWAADGKSIYVMYDEQGNTKLAAFSLDGGQLPANCGDRDSEWPTFSLAKWKPCDKGLNCI